MHLHREEPSRAGAFRLGTAMLLTLTLSGCMGAGGGPDVGMFRMAGSKDPVSGAETTQGELAKAGEAAETRSAIIDQLSDRQSILPGNGSFAEVAQAVLDHASGATEAELRIKRLRAEAKSKNWLPSIGPSVDLTSLASVAASILVEQVIFDNGRRKAERAFAAADVEIAAVTLSEDMNERVYEALSQYVTAQKHSEQADLTEHAIRRMSDYERIVAGRIEGGLSDRSEERVITQKAFEMQTVAISDRQAAQLAWSDVQALAGRPLSHLSGLASLPADPGGPEPLSVLKARATGARMLAEAKIARAGHLPGVKATANITEDGVKGGVRLGADQLLGLGTGAELQALDATEDVVARSEEQARHDANRRLVALKGRHDILAAERTQGETVLQQTRASLDLFTEQYKVGRRSLVELVGMYETFAKMEREQAGLKYDMALIRLQMAKERGVLVSGAKL
jgi:outer membrane protein, adhesin transport system